MARAPHARGGPTCADIGLSPLGLGTSHLASLGSGLSRRAGRALIEAALEAGITTIDTADTYGSGDAERLIGRVLASRRSKCFVVTKAGFPYVAWPGALSPLNQVGKKLLQRVHARKNFTKRYLLGALDKSLARLGVDYVDAFLLHEPTTGETSEESWEALEEIRRSGRARYTGVAASDPAVVEQAFRSGQAQIVQTPVSVRARSRTEVLALCDRWRAPVIANRALAPLASLEASRDWNDLRGRFRVSSVATAQLLIAYAASQQNVSTVLVRTSSVAHLTENLAALKWVGHGLPLFAEMDQVLA